MLITFPSVFALDERRARNQIRQIGVPTLQVEGALTPFERGRLHGFLFRGDGGGDETLVVPKPASIPNHHQRVIAAHVANGNGAIDLRQGTWLKHPIRNGGGGFGFDHSRAIQQVLESWIGAFSYFQEDHDAGIQGLRGPQIGAVHRVHAHWSITDAVATIVMPTGTGKTETMLSILVSARCEKLLVVVPTDALRTQIADKFLTLGILKQPGCGVLATRAKHPIVAVLEHIPRNGGEVDDIFGHSQVIVTTSSIAGQCKPAVQDRMAQHCPYLFIDEAHHAEAPTWSAFKERFKGRRVVQFTATPFREDGKPLMARSSSSTHSRKPSKRAISNQSDSAPSSNSIESVRTPRSPGRRSNSSAPTPTRVTS